MLAGTQHLGPRVDRELHLAKGVTGALADPRRAQPRPGLDLNLSLLLAALSRQLERTRDRLATMGKGVADQLARARGGRSRTTAMQRQQRRVDPGLGTKTAGSTLRSIRTSQQSWTRTLGEP